MSAGRLSATIEFSDTTAGSEPLGTATTLVVDAQGFRSSSGVGGSGTETLDLARVRELLMENFDTNEVCALLDQLVRLRDLLVGTVADKP